MPEDPVPQPVPHSGRRPGDLGRLVQFTAGGLFAAFLVALGGVTGGWEGVAKVAVFALPLAAFSWWLHRLTERG